MAAVKVASEEEALGGQLYEMLVPYPADQIVRIILILREPELALFADNVENLNKQVSVASNGPSKGTPNLLLQQRTSSRDSLPLSWHGQC